MQQGSVGAWRASGVFKHERKENDESKEVVKWTICTCADSLRGGMRGRKHNHAGCAAAGRDGLCIRR